MTPTHIAESKVVAFGNGRLAAVIPKDSVDKFVRGQRVYIVSVDPRTIVGQAMKEAGK